MKTTDNFENKKVLVLGLARSGEAAARLLAKLGAFVTVNDGKPFDENPAAQDLLNEGIRVITGGHPLELLDEDFAYMVKNPGIPYENPMVEKAISRGIPVITEVELAYLVSEAPIVGITGTNGKTTTTTMIGDMLNHAGLPSKLSGNIGFPASEVAQTVTDKDILVMELSSFQLMGIETFRPHIAVITNIDSAHLDYHHTQEAYEAAKYRIQENMTADDFLVVNWSQDKLRDLASRTSATVVPFSSSEKVDGAYLADGNLYFKDELIMPASDMMLPGLHNIENALAAIAVAKLSGAENAPLADVLRTFSGVKHRMQYLGAIDGVKFYNDSKATNIKATQKALGAFEPAKTVLIAGGLDRGNGFDELSDFVKDLKGMIVFGQTADKLKALAEGLGVHVVKVDDVQTAAKFAFEHAAPGDVVLLSPANASWDQFKSFELRGDAFIAAFQELEKSAK